MKTYTIKPLKWEIVDRDQTDVDFITRHSANVNIFDIEYEISEHHDYPLSRCDIYCLATEPPGHWLGEMPEVTTLNEAKAACEADWQERIRAALVEVVK